jgi:hypothetical protein
MVPVNSDPKLNFLYCGYIELYRNMQSMDDRIKEWKAKAYEMAPDDDRVYLIEQIIRLEDMIPPDATANAHNARRQTWLAKFRDNSPMHARILLINEIMRLEDAMAQSASDAETELTLANNTIINLYTKITEMMDNKVFRSSDEPDLILNGDKMWIRNGVLHRDNDLPAVIKADGTQKWYREGKLFRADDKPNVITSVCEFWYNEDEKLHRDNDLPASISSSGYKTWYQNGLIHRDGDQPAEVWPDGNGNYYQRWRQNGKVFRMHDRPAYVYGHIQMVWYVDGVQSRENDLPCMVNTNSGQMEWRNKAGQFHRENGLPAIMRANGNHEYWINGKQSELAAN